MTAKLQEWVVCNNFLSPVAESKDFVYLLDNVPHDWLFVRCAAVVQTSSLCSGLTSLELLQHIFPLV